VVSTFGPEYDLSFIKWLIGAIVPAFIVILLVPQAISIYLRQGNIDLEHTKAYSDRMLRQMKSVSKNEKVNIKIFIHIYIYNFYNYWLSLMKY